MKVKIKNSAGEWHIMKQVHPITGLDWFPDNRYAVAQAFEECKANTLIEVEEGFIPFNSVAMVSFD